jgi:hypothetical protein
VHPSDEEVAAYLERVLSASRRASLQAHLADCDHCRDRLMVASEIQRTVPAARRPVRWRPLGLAAAAVAAVLTGILLLPRFAAREAGNTAEFRAPAQEMEARELPTHAPARNAVVHPETLRLTWSGAGKDATYHVTLSAADGEVLWSGKVTDTSVALPAMATTRLRSGQRYFWRVDALLPDLRAITTGEQSFRVSEP